MGDQEALVKNEEALALLRNIKAQLASAEGLIDMLVTAMVPPAPPPDFVCAKCGSLAWVPGGMGDLYKKCASCGELGGPVDTKQKQ